MVPRGLDPHLPGHVVRRTEASERALANPRLIQSKLRVPGLTSAPVARERLIRGLETHPGRVILLSAPAGFGKTVLVADWIARRPGVAGWLSLDPLDNDLARFVTHLSAALDLPEIDGLAEVRDAVRGTGSTEADERLDLRETLAGVSEEVLLVLDDFHHLQSPPVLRVVEALVDAPRSGLRVALVGRVDPGIALGRLRVSGQLLELRARDLAFTEDEAMVLLDQMLGRSPGSGLVRALTERTEGWPAGLRLAGIALADVDDPVGFVSSFAGTHRFVTEYLMEEALGRQPPELQQFLMDTSVLGRFDAHCCRQILDDPEAPSRLASAAAANLFLVPLGDEGGWYRYHHLFGELLAHRLGRLQPERFQDLHARASRWFEARGHVQEALEHAAAMEDPERTLQLLDAHGLDLLARSEMVGLRRWLGRIEPEEDGPYPLALCTQAWLRVVTERAPDLQRLVTRIQSALEAVPPEYPRARRARATLHTRVLAAYAARYRHSLHEALRIGREAEELLTDDDPLTRGFLVYNTARVHMALGDMEPAASLLDQAFPDHLRAGNHYLTLATLGRQSAVACQMQGVQPALDVLAGAMMFVGERGLGDNPALSIVHFHRGWVHLMADALDEADDAFAEALEGASPRSFPEERANALVGRARVALARGELDRAEDLLVEVAALGQVGNVDLFETTLPLEWRRLALRRAQIGVGPPVPGRPEDEAGEVDGGDWDVHRETAAVLTMGQALSESPDAVPMADAERLVRMSAERRRGPALLTGLLVQAMDPEAPDRWSTVERALLLSATRRYVRPVVELGPAAEPLLRAARSQAGLSAEARAWAGTVLVHGRRDPAWKEAEVGQGGGAATSPAARAPASEAGAVTSPVEPLSPREEEVLVQLLSGKSNKRIARSLYVSVNTVKTHLKHIYAKLGVSGRSEAVVRARDLGYGSDPG